jgi:MOSC domain-containing protein YiiM
MDTTIKSIQVGMPSWLDSDDSSDPSEKPWLSGFRKLPIQGAVEVSETGLAGDGQADLENHGGRDKAILCYCAEHYHAWEIELERESIAFGLFGENLTLAQGTERDVCIGDVFSIGDVKVQVSQPRQPCWKLGRFAGHSELPKKVVRTGFCGWYLRVLQTGIIESGMPFKLEERTQPDWSVRRAHRTMYAKKDDPQFAEKSELSALPELSDAWKNQLGR